MSITRRSLAPTSTPDRDAVADPPTLVAHRVVVQRGGRRLLDDVSLSLAPGELVAVIGASGAGKRTLLESVPALTALASGEIALVPPGVGASRSPYGAVGLVPQDDIL